MDSILPVTMGHGQLELSSLMLAIRWWGREGRSGGGLIKADVQVRLGPPSWMSPVQTSSLPVSRVEMEGAAAARAAKARAMVDFIVVVVVIVVGGGIGDFLPEW